MGIDREPYFVESTNTSSVPTLAPLLSPCFLLSSGDPNIYSSTFTPNFYPRSSVTWQDRPRRSRTHWPQWHGLPPPGVSATHWLDGGAKGHGDVLIGWLLAAQKESGDVGSRFLVFCDWSEPKSRCVRVLVLTLTILNVAIKQSPELILCVIHCTHQ